MDLLSDILSHLRLKGTLYFRTSFTSPWSIEVPSFENVSRFHFAHRGRCLVRINPDEDPVRLEQGDLVIITRGAGHTLYCDPTTEHPAMILDDVVKQSGFNGEGALVYGVAGTHHETQLICGHFAFDSDARHPLIDALPSHIHIRNYGQSAGLWMENNLKMIGAEAGQGGMGSDVIALKMSEIIYAQALRAFLNDEALREQRLAGYSDPAIARVLKAIHDNPGKQWNLENLSREAGLSRTSLTNKFSTYLTITPLGYITQWRMQLARKQLVDSNAAIINIAENVGYQSEASFGRIFKKHFGVAPASYRKQKHSQSQPTT